MADVAVSYEIKGGARTAKVLAEIAERATRGGALKVGFLAGRTYPNGLPVALVAFWNEFGTKRAPPRPFFRTTIATESKRWGDILAAAIIHYNYDGAQALRALGTEMSDDITASIQRWTTPPNAASTIARKGFNKPLVHTRVLVDSPNYELTA